MFDGSKFRFADVVTTARSEGEGDSGEDGEGGEDREGWITWSQKVRPESLRQVTLDLGITGYSEFIGDS